MATRSEGWAGRSLLRLFAFRLFALRLFQKQNHRSDASDWMLDFSDLCYRAVPSAAETDRYQVCGVIEVQMTPDLFF